MVNFNKKVDRYGTFCTQWDFISDRFNKEDLLPFTISDMDLESPEEIIDVLEGRMGHKVFGYSRWNHDPYKQSIKRWYKRRFDTEISKNSIVYSPSVMYSVSKLIEIWSNIGEGILTLTPAYDGFFKCIEGNKRRLVTSKLIEKDGEYKIDFNDFENKCRVTKIFLLCNPHNPTGKVFTEEELIKIIEICEKHKIKIISDDIHMDITYKRKAIPIIKLTQSPNIAICTSTSKTFNIPALTGSYAIITGDKDRERFLDILKNRDGLSSPSIFSVLGTIVAYDNCEYFVDELKVHTLGNIEFVKRYLEENIKELKVSIPDGLYFAWINFEDLNVTSEKLQEALIDIGKVAIMPGKTYGKEGEHYLRLNIGCSRQKVELGLEKIKKAVDSLKK